MPRRKVYDLIFKKQISTKVDNSSLLNKQGYASTSQFIESSYVLNKNVQTQDCSIKNLTGLHLNVFRHEVGMHSV